MVKKKKFHIITIGCQMNKSDSERIAGYLEENGLEKSKESKESDIVILTTCGVRQGAESRIYGLVPKLKKENKRVQLVITGCLSERDDVKKRLNKSVDVWLPIRELASLAQKLGLDNNVGDSEYKDDYLKFSPAYNSSFSAFVPIGNGCNNYCTYCVVPYARGPEKYRSAVDIITEVENLVARGFKEITLIAQNVNSYVSDDINFPELLRRVNSVQGDFWLRFATSHPKDMSDELIDVLSECKKLCESVHLPAQSGNNNILKAMNRKYSVEEYKRLIDKIKELIPGVAISTDIIVGFPGETDKQFKNTVELFEYVKYDMAYVAQYSPRPGTEANEMDDNVSVEEKKHREERLMELLSNSSLENNKKYLKSKVEVLVEGRNKKGMWYGKTRTNKMVRFENDATNMEGKIAKVLITYVENFGMTGIIKK